MREDPSTITLVDNDAMALWYHPKEKIIHHQFRQFVHGELLCQMMTKGADVFVEKGVHKWLSDDRGNGPMREEDVKWLQTNWLPRVLAAGWKFWAVVMPLSTLGQMNMRRWIKMYADMGVTAKAFSDLDEAFDWLAEQK